MIGQHLQVYLAIEVTCKPGWYSSQCTGCRIRMTFDLWCAGTYQLCVIEQQPLWRIPCQMGRYISYKQWNLVTNKCWMSHSVPLPKDITENSVLLCNFKVSLLMLIYKPEAAANCYPLMYHGWCWRRMRQRRKSIASALLE